MPMYVYVCSECGNQFERISSVADGDKQLEVPCSECGAKLTRPIYENVPTIHLRGYSPCHPRFFRGMRPR